MNRLVVLLPLALTGSVWLPPLGIAPSAATPMDFAGPATFPSEMPNWRADPLGAAMREAALIDDPEHRATERASMVAGLVGAGYLEEAEAVLDMAIDEALAWPLPYDNHDRASALFAMAKRLAGAGISDMTAKVLVLALEEGGKLWLKAEISDYVRVAMAVGGREMAEEAWEVLDWDPVSRANARFNYVAPHLYRQGEREEAVLMVTANLEFQRSRDHTLQDPSSDLGEFDFLLRYIERYLTMDEPELALALVPEARTALDGAGDFEETAFALMKLSYFAYLCGEPDLALRLIEESRILADRSIDARWWRKGGFVNWWRQTFVRGYKRSGLKAGQDRVLAWAYTDLGMWAEARAVTAQITDGNVQDWAWSWWGVALANDGQELAALRVVERLDEEGVTGRKPVLNAIALHHLAEGRPEQAWGLWRNKGFAATYEVAEGLVGQWQAAGDAESLFEYLDMPPRIRGARWGTPHTVHGMDAWRLHSAPVLYGIGSRRMAGYLTLFADDILKAKPYIEIARALHTHGEQDGAIRAMEAAAVMAAGGERVCEVNSYPYTPDGSGSCLPPEEKTKEQLRALVRHHIAAGWAQIGEFDRAVATVALLGPVEMAWVDVETGRFPRLEALRAIGIAMLAQGALPPSYLESLVDSARQGDLVAAP